LDTADGKNDGSVANVRYFTCAANFGLFVKKAQIKLDKDEASSSSAAARAKKPEVKEEVPSEAKKSGALTCDM
jgi:dynactin complex subunit